MGDEHDRWPGQFPQRQQLVGHDRPGLHVQRGERLVHQQDPGLVDQALRERDPLAHTAGELVRKAVLEAGQTDPAQPVPCLLVGILFGHAAEQRAGGDVGQHALPWQHGVVLEDEPDARADPGHRLRIDQHLAIGRGLQARDQRQRGGFPTAGRAYHGAELAFGDLQIEITQRGVFATGGSGEPLGHVAQLNGCAHCRAPWTSLSVEEPR